MSRIGIWHPGVSSNHGDRAIQLATIDLVKQRYPDATVIQFHDDIAEANEAYRGEGVTTLPLNRFGMPSRDDLRGLDLLLWGGGSLVQQSSLFFAPRHALPAILAKQVGTPVACFGSGVEPLSNPLLRRLTRYLFDRVMVDALVRGSRSAELLRSYGVERPVRVAPDQAVTLAADSVEAGRAFLESTLQTKLQKPVVTVTVKPSFIYRGGILPVSVELPGPAKREREQRREEFEASFAALIDHIRSTVGATVVMVPMYIGQGDLDSARRVATMASSDSQVHVLESMPPSRLLKAVFSQATVHVGVRLHSCILATSSGVPALAVPYMEKAREYFEMIGIPEHTLDEADVTPDALISAFDRIWRDRDLVRAQLADTLPQLRARVTREAHDLLAGSLGTEDIRTMNEPS